MSQKQQIQVDHMSYHCEALPDEHDQARMWFIAQHRPMNQADWDHIKELSVYWYFSNRLGCTYNNSIQRRLTNALN